MTIGFFIGMLLFVIGLITYWLAPRFGPNPIFGVRIGYAFASREIWDRTNRTGGALIALTGIGVVLLAFVMQWLSISDNAALVSLSSAMVVALIGETVWLGLYARRLAQGTSQATEFIKIRFRWMYLAPTLISFALLLAVAAWVYPLLPADRIATHFGVNDQPNGWMSRDYALFFFLGMGLAFVLIDAFITFLATREPLIVFARWGTRWRLAPERGLIFAGAALAFANLILVYALWDITWFAVRGAHIVPLVTFFWIVLLIIPIMIGLFFLLAKHERGGD